MKQWMTLLLVFCLLTAMVGCGGSDNESADNTDSVQTVCDHYFYTDLTCVSCGMMLDSLEDMSGELYGRPVDWGSVTATMDILSSDTSHLADGFSATDTGLRETFDLAGVPVSVDYRLCDGGMALSFDSIDDALAYKPQHPYDAKYAGKPLRESLGDEIIVYMMLDRGEVYLAEIIFR